MLNFISGGFLKVKRTYLLGALMALQAVISWAVGDLSLTELLAQIPEILTGLGLMALRAGMEPKKAE